MPLPTEYSRATEEFYDFLTDVQHVTGFTSTHQTYTMVQGVFQTFRRRLSIKNAITFANVLPPVLRAIFVADWDVDEAKREFGDRDTMTKEVQALRHEHNFAPETAISDVASVIRRHLDGEKFDALLATFPDGAVAFWEEEEA